MPVAINAEVADLIKRAAADAGFDLCGIAPAADAPEHKYFPEWIAAGRAGEMKYMEARDERGDLKRASLARVAPWAHSVIVCAINYNTGHPYSTQVRDPDRECSKTAWISRYAWSREDYHDAVMRRLRQVEGTLQNAVAAQGLTTRCYVDTGPIVERVFAKYAGVGWIGKNTCLINQKKGSWLFLGVILTALEITADLSAANLPAPDRCGTCTRCIEACPTNAIVAPYQLDSNRCIAYLTIEKRGKIPEEFRAQIGRHVFGCDICQDVCPWNRKAPVTAAREFEARDGMVNPALEWLAEMSEDEFRSAFRGSPLRRAKRSGLRRNAAIAMGNGGNRDFLPILEEMAKDDDENVRESSLWAKRRIESQT